MLFSFSNIFALLASYGYLVLFPIMVVEGPIITIIAGFLASLGYMNFTLVYIVVVVGDLTGDALYYAVGRFGRMSFIDRWGHWIGITSQRVEKIERHFADHAGKTLILGKLSHAIGGIILVAAGVARIRFWRYLWFNFLATLPKSMLLLLIGYYFGQAYAMINKYLDLSVFIALGLGIMYIGLYYGIKYFAKKLDRE